MRRLRKRAVDVRQVLKREGAVAMGRGVMGRKADRKRWRVRRASERRLQRILKHRNRRALKLRIRERRSRAWHTPSREMVIPVPRNVTLNGRAHQAELTKFLHELRLSFRKKDGQLCIDFRQCRKLFPEGTLLFFAELTRLIEGFPAKARRCIPAIDVTVNGVLQHLGLYALLGHESARVPEGRDVVNWRVARAPNVDGERAGEALLAMEMSSERTSDLFRGVTEAITNVSNHAHIASRKDGLHLPIKKEWWMFCREDDDSLYVAVCDLGIGIPRSLPRVHASEVLADALSRMFGNRRPTDGRMIKAALRLRRTRTEQRYRGKGFTDILSVANRSEGSALRIYSNRGRVSYSADTLIPVIRDRTFKYSILGTIIVWVFPLKGKGHEN